MRQTFLHGQRRLPAGWGHATSSCHAHHHACINCTRLTLNVPVGLHTAFRQRRQPNGVRAGGRVSQGVTAWVQTVPLANTHSIINLAHAWDGVLTHAQQAPQPIHLWGHWSLAARHVVAGASYHSTRCLPTSSSACGRDLSAGGGAQQVAERTFALGCNTDWLVAWWHAQVALGPSAAPCMNQK